MDRRHSAHRHPLQFWIHRFHPCEALGRLPRSRNLDHRFLQPFAVVSSTGIAMDRALCDGLYLRHTTRVVSSDQVVGKQAMEMGFASKHSFAHFASYTRLSRRHFSRLCWVNRWLSRARSLATSRRPIDWGK